MELEEQWCDQAACPDRGKTGQDNIRPYGRAERRYRCTTCRHTFNADKGTFFETIRTERAVVLDAIGMLGERNSLRGTWPAEALQTGYGLALAGFGWAARRRRQRLLYSCSAYLAGPDR